MEIDLTEVRAELRETLRKSQIVESALAKKLIRRSDDQQVVTATANGLGDLVDIQISDEALRYPSRLGTQMLAAIKRACRAGEEFEAKFRETHCPEVFSLGKLNIPMSAAPVDMHQIEHYGSPRARDITARYMEQLRKLAVAEEGFRRRYVRRQIGAGAGWIVCSLAGEVTEIAIDASAPRNVTLNRLGRQVVDAVGEALIHAGRLRGAEIDECIDKDW